MFVGALLIMIGFFGLALDLAQVYNRKAELQNVADTVALAAALELNGTEQGITNAVEKASDRFTATATGALTYQYGKGSIDWSASAISFGRTPDGPWLSVQDAKANAGELQFVRFQTADLGATYGKVQTLFIQFFSKVPAVSTGAAATAGRSAMKVTPLGLCAMRGESHRDHNGELEEYGFRRGVGYNLMDLSPATSTEGQTFLVNPLPGTVLVTGTDKLAPFVCTGTIAMTRLTGSKIVVSAKFPLSTLYYHLNSRFGTYSAPLAACNPVNAPPDSNVKEYTFNAGSPWMGATPAGQSAALSESENKRWTVAGPDTPPNGTTATSYGPLWAYAKAARYASYEEGKPEPPGGYSTFETTDWATLYHSSLTTSTATAYPSDPAKPTPYSQDKTGALFKAPTSGKSVRQRRVLNVPLLACPVSGNRATVLGIGKFFMTVPATETALYGEFAGLVSEQSLGTQVELY